MKIFSILSLLPQCSGTQLPTHLKFSKVLKLLRFFTFHTIQALENFYIKNNFHEFDPHVGETSCQIRAYQIQMLAANTTATDKLSIQKKLFCLRGILSKIDQEIPHYLKKDSTKRNKDEHPVTLKNFIYDNGYYFELDRLEIFLTQASILTIYKKYYSNNDTAIGYDELCNDLAVSKHTARKLIHIYQIELSEASCKFIKNISEENPSKIINSEILNLLKQVDDDGRQVLPSYVVTKIILSHIKWRKMPILLIIKREQAGKTIDTILVPFIVSHDNSFQIDTSFRVTSPHENFYILKGITTYKNEHIETKQELIKRIINLGLENIIFFNMAAHPQYSGRKLQHLSENPFFSCGIEKKNENFLTFVDEFLSQKMQSTIFGCNSFNSSLFYIEHIFCDTLARQASLIRDLPENTMNSNKSVFFKPTFDNGRLIVNESSS